MFIKCDNPHKTLLVNLLCFLKCEQTFGSHLDRLAISFFNSKRYFNILNLPVKSLAFPIKFEKVNPRLKEKRKVKRLQWKIEKIRF